MARRLTVSFVHESPGRDGGKPFKKWHNVGDANESDNGYITVRLRALPVAPQNGEYVFILQEPKSNGPRGGDEGGGLF